jgi:transposase-like protein
MRSLDDFCCQNPLCSDSCIRRKDNLRWHGWSGHKREIRCLRCRTCKKCFSERKGTVLEQSRLPLATAISLMEHLREGCGVRGTARLVNVTPNTVVRYARVAGEHAKLLHDELVEQSPMTKEVQFDEKWNFVYKKQANCEENEKERGDNWDHTAIDTEHRLLLTIVPGKRTAENCKKVVDDVKKRTNGRTDILMTSDEHAPYKPAIEEAYATQEKQPDGSTKSVMPEELCYATVSKTRKNGRVTNIEKKLVFGDWILLLLYIFLSVVSNTINTSFVERNNATDRNQNSRKARKTLRFSKDWLIHNSMTYYVAYSYNFCWPVRTLRVKSDDGKWKSRTPAMSAGLADRVWTTYEWISYPARPCMST